jgi:hypothetical protein
MNWKMLVKLIVPMIRLAGEGKKAEDANTTGKDDLIGVSLVYAADLLDAVVGDKELPKAPAALR